MLRAVSQEPYAGTDPLLVAAATNRDSPAALKPGDGLGTPRRGVLGRGVPGTAQVTAASPQKAPRLHQPARGDGFCAASPHKTGRGLQPGGTLRSSTEVCVWSKWKTQEPVGYWGMVTLSRTTVQSTGSVWYRDFLNNLAEK